MKTYSNSVVKCWWERRSYVAIGLVVHITIKALTKPTIIFLQTCPNPNYKQDYKT